MTKNVLDSLIAQWDRCNAYRVPRKLDTCGKRRCKRCRRGAAYTDSGQGYVR